MNEQHHPPQDLTLEADSRFPSGEWTGFFRQPVLPGRHWMELHLTFKEGILSGEGRDWVGKFLVKGRYSTEDGRCHWVKSYLSKHSVHYVGYNEGKGIWGTWEIDSTWRGGFYIWPISMGDPTQQELKEELDEPVLVEETGRELMPVGADE